MPSSKSTYLSLDISNFDTNTLLDRKEVHPKHRCPINYFVCYVFLVQRVMEVAIQVYDLFSRKEKALLNCSKIGSYWQFVP
jgi:hypothetical protein